jgi:CheY-like chemotaxis protein
MPFRGAMGIPGREGAGLGKQSDTRQLVLVVEDDPDAQRVAESMLNMLGYTTRLAPNGREALRLLAKLTPAAILLDLHMPELDGLAFLDTATREVEGFDQIRVIATSGVYRNQTSISRPLRRRGVENFVGKPFSLQRLKQAMDGAFGETRAIEAEADDEVLDIEVGDEPDAVPDNPASDSVRRPPLVRPPSSGPTEDVSTPRRPNRRGALTGEHARVVLPRASGAFSRPGQARPSGAFSRPGSARPSGELSRPGGPRPSGSFSRPGAPKPSMITRPGGLVRPITERKSGAYQRPSAPPVAKPIAPPPTKPIAPPPTKPIAPPPAKPPRPERPPLRRPPPEPGPAKLSRPGAAVPSLPPFEDDGQAARRRPTSPKPLRPDPTQSQTRTATGSTPLRPEAPSLDEAPRVKVAANGELSTTSGAGGPDTPEVGSEHGEEERFACYYGAAIFFRRSVESAAITEVSAAGVRLLANKSRLKLDDVVELRAHVDMPDGSDGLLDLRIDSRVVWLSAEGGRTHIGLELQAVEPMEGFARLLASLHKMKERKRTRR